MGAAFEGPSKTPANAPPGIIATVSQPPIHLMIRALAENGAPGAIDIAQHAVEMFLAASPTDADRALAVDILLRDLASLRGVAPHITAFIGRIEMQLGRIRRDALKRPAQRPVPADAEMTEEPVPSEVEAEPALQAA